jgi:hypothetical protein
LVETAVFTHELLSRHGIFHWLDYGSLLGAVRSGELIPWDDDVDFGFLASDIDRVLALGPEVAAEGHELATGDPQIVRINFSPLNTQHVDLFPWVESDELMSKAKPDFDWLGMEGRESFPRRYIDHLRAVDLHGHEMPAPSPVGDFLANHRYGPDYMTPKRTVLDWWLLPSISPEEMTGSVTRLVEELGREERKEMALLAGSPWWRLPIGRRWLHAGRPLSPPPQVLDSIMETLLDEPEREREPVVELAGRLALTRSNVEELEHPSAHLVATRMGRRAVRARRNLKKVVSRRLGAQPAPQPSGAQS